VINTRLDVVAPGIATTVQDLGRTGYAALGVPGAGAVDRAMAALVNRLVGNPAWAAVIETAGGLAVRPTGPVVIATSAELAVRTIGAGETIAVAPAVGSWWAYLAVRGGVDVAPVLGSRSRDTLSALGPPPPTAGDRLPVGPDPGTPLTVDTAAVATPPDHVVVWPGPRADWFTAEALTDLVSTTWAVGPASNRVGVRLAGARLRRAVDDELPSEGLVTGAVQVPADGQPVVMSRDHPTTGGYPVIAVVDPRHLDAFLQRPPGATARFRWTAEDRSAVPSATPP